MTTSEPTGGAFDELWAQLLPTGRDPAGGYRRFAWTDTDLQLREWFTDAAKRRGLDVQPDRNGNLWAWWLPDGWTGEPRDAFVTGSHLDSVPGGGAYDGPLGVVSALCAVDVLKERELRPAKPAAVVVFADEEGSRFGVACAGSRLMTGALEPDRARSLTDADGVRLEVAMKRAGSEPGHLGRDDETLARIGAFVELHIEQGRALIDVGSPIGVASAIWPHGRWRFSFSGEANHAGTTRLLDRRDPTLAHAAAVLAAREVAASHGGVATVGRVRLHPNATNAVPSSVDAWLDVRAPSQSAVDAIVADVDAAARRRADAEGVGCELVTESTTELVEFSPELRRFAMGTLGELPELATGAGHDAGVLAGVVPTGMLFVRNPTGVSHAPAEHAERADCLAGVAALAELMAGWVG